MSVIHELDKTVDPAVRAELLALVEPLHRQLRPKIPEPYAAWIGCMLEEGAHLSALVEDGTPWTLAVWRVHHTTFAGISFYIDDLVTDEARRGQGHGARLLAALEERARHLGCDTISVEAGVRREAAHRFYFRAGLTITSFAFGKRLSGRF